MTEPTSLVASFVFDSFFWKKDALPELTSFMFNVAQGQSAQWGVSGMSIELDGWPR